MIVTLPERGTVARKTPLVIAGHVVVGHSGCGHLKRLQRANVLSYLVPPRGESHTTRWCRLIGANIIALILQSSGEVINHPHIYLRGGYQRHPDRDRGPLFTARDPMSFRVQPSKHQHRNTQAVAAASVLQSA